MKKNIKFYPGALETLNKKNKFDIEDKLSKLLDKSKTYKKAEVATIGEAYHQKKWRGNKVVPLTNMHIARFLKR